MKHQQVSVDYWAMGKAMLTYGAMSCLVWLMLRLFSAVFMLPRRLRSQQESMENTLKELQRRYPDLNITEEDLVNAEKELEEIMKETKETDTETDKVVSEIDGNAEETKKGDKGDEPDEEDDTKCTEESKKTI